MQPPSILHCLLIRWAQSIYYLKSAQESDVKQGSTQTSERGRTVCFPASESSGLGDVVLPINTESPKRENVNKKIMVLDVEKLDNK